MVFVWLADILLVVALIVLVVFQSTCLTNLEFDFINLYDATSQINKVIMPEFVLQALLSALFLLSGHWAMFLISAPMVYYNYRLYRRRQHLVDVTEIFRQLSLQKKRRFFKIAGLLAIMLLSFFWMLRSFLSEFND